MQGYNICSVEKFVMTALKLMFGYGEFWLKISFKNSGFWVKILCHQYHMNKGYCNHLYKIKDYLSMGDGNNRYILDVDLNTVLTLCFRRTLPIWSIIRLIFGRKVTEFVTLIDVSEHYLIQIDIGMARWSKKLTTDNFCDGWWW